MFGTGVIAELLLEALRLGSVDQPAGAQGIDDLGDVAIAQVGFGNRKEFICQAFVSAKPLMALQSSFVIGASCGARCAARG